MHCIYENANIPVQQCMLQEVININIFGTMPFPSTTFYRKATFSFAKLSHVPRQNALSMVTNTWSIRSSIQLSWFTGTKSYGNAVLIELASKSLLAAVYVK